ncbi:MAG: hypothetical protein JW709_03455 [Sedimentisphaerales bacterium]|nr:hypothetical protein [Sedimentisphaerales bacterium]
MGIAGVLAGMGVSCRQDVGGTLIFLFRDGELSAEAVDEKIPQGVDGVVMDAVFFGKCIRPLFGVDL